MASLCFILQVDTVEGQMRSKGGYDHLSPVNIHLNVINLEQQS